MPCLRKAASQSRLSTSLTMMKDPTQVFWTVETVPGLWVFLHVIVCVQICMCSHFCGSVPSYCALLNIFPPLTVSSSWTSFYLMVCRDGSRIGLVSWPLSVFQPDFRQLFSDDSWSDTDYLDLSVTELQRLEQKPFYLFVCLFFSFFGLLSGYTSNSLIHTFTDHCTFTLL